MNEYGRSRYQAVEVYLPAYEDCAYRHRCLVDEMRRQVDGDVQIIQPIDVNNLAPFDVYLVPLNVI
jgi:hypothetical protein